MVEIKTDQKKNGDFELMNKKLEESHLKCYLLENQLVTYKLNGKQSSNKIHKLAKEKKEAINFALKLQYFVFYPCLANQMLNFVQLN